MKKRVLIAEDEKPIAKALHLKLSSSDYEAVVAKNGEEALAKLKEEHFDVLLLDLMMPIVDGFMVLERLKETENSIPVIILSNLSQEEDIQKAKELGAKDFFVKSNTPISEVVDYVKNALKK